MTTQVESQEKIGLPQSVVLHGRKNGSPNRMKLGSSRAALTRSSCNKRQALVAQVEIGLSPECGRERGAEGSLPIDSHLIGHTSTLTSRGAAVQCAKEKAHHSVPSTPPFKDGGHPRRTLPTRRLHARTQIGSRTQGLLSGCNDTLVVQRIASLSCKGRISCVTVAGGCLPVDSHLSGRFPTV